MSEIALAICILSLVAIIGLWIGNWRIYGVGLGIGGVLFGGIAIGHFAKLYGLEVNLHTLEFIREFGLILFVYTIGIQVGPGFFASLRTSGLKLNLFAALLVVLGCIVAVILHKIWGIPLPVILGTYSGAVTNTPSLGAGQLMLSELGADSNVMTLSYAVAYPFGICGILLSMWLIRFVFRINVDSEARLYQQQSGLGHGNLQTMNIEIRNSNLSGLTLQEIPDLEEGEVVCSRLKRGDVLMVPKPDTVVQLGDLLHLVGDKKALKKVRLVIGEEVATSLSTQGTELRVERVVVTNEKVLGKTLGDLELKSKFDVVVSRLNRAGIELVPGSGSSLQFGDILNLVGRPESIEAVAGLVGNAQHKLQQVQMLPVFLGIGLGVIVGSIPFYIPGFSAALKLGLAGGPLVVALILSRIGSIGKLYWFMPPSANLALREIGIVLFLSVVGLKSGGEFVSTLVDGDGLLWMACGAVITLLPLLVVGFLARVFGKINYLSLCGMLAGSMTDPPALAFANAMHPTSDAAALSYATVYPMVMFLRIISPQLLVILLWSGG
ncbi:YidE/YbjL duplication [Tolumonas auensis DSM 9187]|jgi:putative transport protein|uniref:YidE/YbjL duplication n=1 Tax=Tolumonas auensis (strain DSM 9187 / NBRC 110442 / TA 4) TaxID=595494 RepID=C4L8B8_TOLAT|nr:putative transporter [Tolumonas auensis]ACQ93764.1 YidE/YbjL duplication [Tolumonas auensis DSM 9187]